MNKNLLIILAISASLIGLFIWASTAKEGNLRMFKDTQIACLPNGHANLADHIHPQLNIVVDGEPEIIPADIGIIPGCMSEIHTHDETGVIHAESSIPNRVKNFTLADFYMVWGQDSIREGYTLEIIQDAEIKESINDVQMIDLSIIELRYTSI